MRTSTSFERGYPRQLLILDTGPIRELVTFYAVHEFGFERLRSELRVFQDRGAYQTCGKFIGTFRRKTTSASVVAELHTWIRDTDPGGQGRLWNRVYEEFREMGMDEEAVKLLEMDRDLVKRLGPVDVSLLALGRRHADHDPLVLTIDSELHGECKKAGLQVSLIQEIVFMVR